MPRTFSARTRTLLDLAAIVLVLAAVVAVGFVLTVWTGFPKGTDAYSHLTRLRFVADFFPRHEWLYSWAAGMPTFQVGRSWEERFALSKSVGKEALAERRFGGAIPHIQARMGQRRARPD